MATRTPPKPPPLKKPEQAPAQEQPDSSDEVSTPQEDLRESLDAIETWAGIAKNALAEIEGEIEGDEEKEPEE
jgi:hypothetical protein